MKNNYIAPWHIFVAFKGMPAITSELQTPEIYYS